MKGQSNDAVVVVEDKWRLRLLEWAERGGMATWDERARAGWLTNGVYMTWEEFTVVARSLALDGLS